MSEVEKLAKRLEDSFSNNLNYNCVFHPLKSHPNFNRLPDVIVEFYEKIGVGSLGSSFLYFNINEPNFFDKESENFIFYIASEYEYFNSDFDSKLEDVLLIGHDVYTNWFGFDVRLNKFIRQDDKQEIDIVDILNRYIDDYR